MFEVINQIRSMIFDHDYIGLGSGAINFEEDHPLVDFFLRLGGH